MHKVVVRSICQLSFLLFCNIYGYFSACYKWLIFGLKSAFTYFPGTLSKVPPSAFSFCSLVVSSSSLSRVGVKTAVSQWELFAWLPFFQNHRLLCLYSWRPRQTVGILNTVPLENVLLPFRTENVCDTDYLSREKWRIIWCLNTKGFNNLGVYSNVLNI